MSGCSVNLVATEPVLQAVICGYLYWCLALVLSRAILLPLLKFHAEILVLPSHEMCVESLSDLIVQLYDQVLSLLHIDSEKLYANNNIHGYYSITKNLEGVRLEH